MAEPSDSSPSDSSSLVPNLTMDIFTEDVFSKENEALLKDALESLELFLPPSNQEEASSQIQINRQTPLLDTVKKMATTDIFIPASSFLSAFAAFFHSSSGGSTVSYDFMPSLIIMPEEATRRTKYFAPHLMYATRSEPKEPSDGALVCPIVSTACADEVHDALKELLTRRMGD